MMNFKRRAAFLAVPAILALAAVSYGSVVAFSAASPSPTGTETETAEAAEPADSTAPEAGEGNELVELSDGGSADPDNVQSDTQQEGQH
jgi:hypothetical protein